LIIDILLGEIMKKFSTGLALALIGFSLLGGCKDDDSSSSTSSSQVELKNRSVTPAFVNLKMDGISAYTLISSDDVLEQSKDFVFGGSPDGSGLLKNSDGTYTYIVSNEDNYSVARIILDKTFKPIKGEYIVNSDQGLYRLCSGSMATVAEHGFGPFFFSCGESSPESQILGINPYAAKGSAHKYLTALGRWSAENAVPLNKNSYPGKTAIIIGDDDSGPEGGQVGLYLSNTVGDLDNGKLYVMARTNSDTTEKHMVAGQSYDVEFRQFKDQTAKNLNPQTTELSAIRFGRVEDLDYVKNGAEGGRTIFFTATGQKEYPDSRTKHGRLYKLTLDASNPLKGKLECVLDGDDKTGPAKMFQDPDNVCVTKNYVYIQEDPNGYGDETHDTYVYQYNIATKELKVVLELNHNRGVANPNNGGALYDKVGSAFGSWETGSLIDISDIIGIPDVFILNIQPHSWKGDKYKNPDKGALRASENQAGQTIILKGLPR
jgi:hypothetical protein